MPPIRSQTVNLDGVTIVTQHYGTIAVTVATTGNTTSVVIRRDGVQVNQATLNNASVAGLKLAINGLLNPSQLATVGLTGFAMHIVVHVFAVNPFVAAWMSSDLVPTGTWWA